jgi:hypothetical protein
MGRYLDLADRVLNVESSSSNGRYDKDDLNDESMRVRGVSLASLKEAAGKDWSEIMRDPALLDAFAQAVAIRRMREAGTVPAHYTAVTVCAGCGPVPIFQGVGEHVLGCPWCFNRHAGLPIPTASTMVPKLREMPGNEPASRP